MESCIIVRIHRIDIYSFLSENLENFCTRFIPASICRSINTWTMAYWYFMPLITRIHRNHFKSKCALDIQKLVGNSQGSGHDILVPGNTNDWSISTYWLKIRWPRVVIKDDNNWEAVAQWYNQGNVVIQSIVCQNNSDDPLNLWCTTNHHVRIPQLDFDNDSHFFNRGEELHAEGAGPGVYGFIRIQRLPSKDTESEQNSDLDAVAAVLGPWPASDPGRL